MSASFYELLKYAKTGLASPGMTAYDKMRARAAAGGGTIKTLTGVPPLSFTGNGKPLVSWSMLGNGQQTGTPTPDTPIMPKFVGVKTAQIIDYTLSESGGIDASGNPTVAANLWRSNVFYGIHSGIALSFVQYSTLSAVRVNYYDANYTHISREQINVGSASGVSLTIPADAKYFKWTLYASSGTIVDIDFVRQCYIMLNTGSTALPYEPYGWAEKITCAGQTVPVYLGQTQTLRRVKKLVLTGKENVGKANSGVLYITLVGGLTAGAGGYSTHYINVNESQSSSMPLNSFTTKGGANNSLWFQTVYSTSADFKSYLAQQYAAGTPVTVWYVLATPETAIVNEPLCKIGDYADELSSTDAGVSIPIAKGENTLTVDTDLQPSSMTIVYKS